MLSNLKNDIAPYLEALNYMQRSCCTVVSTLSSTWLHVTWRSYGV